MKNKTAGYRFLMLCLGLTLTAAAQAGGVKKHSDDLGVPQQQENGDQQDHGSGSSGAGSSGTGQDVDDVPTGKGWGQPQFGAAKRVTTSSVPQNGINYHGGPVLGVSSAPNVYYIWYGNWSGNTAPTILQNLAGFIGGTPRYNIETTYTNSSGTPIKNAVTYVSSINDNYSQGAPVNGTATLTDQGVLNVVSSAISKKKLPLDPNGVYFVLTSADVNESSGFCTNYCGWHSYASISRKVVKLAFVGNPERCPSACTAQPTNSPNGNVGADGMASIIVHELEEAVTDPQLNAWYDAVGNENADKCAWQFGNLGLAANGSYYNVVVGGYEYLLQQNWVNAGGGSCASAY